MHNPNGDQRKSDKRKANRLRRRVRESADYNNLVAPNEFDEIGFDDFVLFSRAGKQLAADICTATTPSDPELIECMLTNHELMKKAQAFNGNPERVKHLLMRFLSLEYGIPDVRSAQLSKQLSKTYTHSPLA